MHGCPEFDKDDPTGGQVMANKKSERVILVAGATGRQGGATIIQLLAKNFPVRALTRNPDKPEARKLVGHGTEVVRGDLNDPDSLSRAVEGVYGVFSVQTHAEHGVAVEVRQGINLADAAKRARVSHFVYSSVGSADQRTGIPHFDSKARVEDHIRGTGLRYTIFRPVFFMENLLGMRDRIEQGRLALPLKPEARLQMIAVDDIGAFVAMAFEKPGHWQGQTLDIAGDEVSMSELAASLSRIAGHDVHYEQTPWDQFEQAAGREMSAMYRWFEEVGYHVDIAAVRREYPNLMTLERWFQSKWRKAFAA
jgi:uncharacterized protein YbjT (DUF2867 family)